MYAIVGYTRNLHTIFVVPTICKQNHVLTEHNVEGDSSDYSSDCPNSAQLCAALSLSSSSYLIIIIFNDHMFNQLTVSSSFTSSYVIDARVTLLRCMLHGCRFYLIFCCFVVLFMRIVALLGLTCSYTPIMGGVAEGGGRGRPGIKYTQNESKFRCCQKQISVKIDK